MFIDLAHMHCVTTVLEQGYSFCRPYNIDVQGHSFLQTLSLLTEAILMFIDIAHMHCVANVLEQGYSVLQTLSCFF